jgi:sugar-specific transcriptional regulator TrmB
MNDKLLNSLGLSPSEILVYKAILKNDNLTPVALAKSSGVKRTTAYSIARSLVEKGLVVEDSTRRPRIFKAATPNEVLTIIENEKRRVLEREESLKNLATELAKVSAATTYPVPEIKFIEEAKIETFLKSQTPAWNKSMAEADSAWWGFQDHTFVENYAEWLDWLWKHAPEYLRVNLLSNRAPAEIEFAKTKKETRRTIKFWGEANSFISTTWIMGDYVVILNTRNHPFYLIEIHDKLMAHDQREIYRNLWELV